MNSSPVSDINPCRDQDLCKNGGTCANVDVDGQVAKAYRCSCVDDFHGDHCELGQSFVWFPQKNILHQQHVEQKRSPFVLKRFFLGRKTATRSSFSKAKIWFWFPSFSKCVWHYFDLKFRSALVFAVRSPIEAAVFFSTLLANPRNAFSFFRFSDR